MKTRTISTNTDSISINHDLKPMVFKALALVVWVENEDLLEVLVVIPA